MNEADDQIDYMIESKDRLIRDLRAENARLKDQVAELTPPTLGELVEAARDKTKQIETHSVFSGDWSQSMYDAGTWQRCCDAYGPDVRAHGHRIVDVTPEPEMVRIDKLPGRTPVGWKYPVWAISRNGDGGWSARTETAVTSTPLTVVPDEHGYPCVACEPEGAES